MVKVKLHDLSCSTKDACAGRRAFSFPLEEKSSALKDSAAATINLMWQMFRGEIKREDLPELMEQAFEKVPFTSSRQRKEKAKINAMLLERLVSSEKNTPVPAPMQDVELGSGLVCQTSPTYVKFYDDIVEVVKVHWGLPQLTTKTAPEKSLELYALFKYGEHVVKPGNAAHVRASVYYLRKKSDRFDEDDLSFKEDFFDTKGDGNIVSVDAFVERDPDGTFHETLLDRTYGPGVEKYLKGIPEEECSKEECRHCILFQICSYARPPLRIKKLPVTRSVNDISLSSYQEDAINFRKGILRVNAGAGTGKTLTIALRICALLSEGVQPEEILLITFTNAGAKEMKERISLYCEDMGLDIDTEKIMCTTFNSFGSVILSRNYEALGFSAEPKVIDDIERSRIIADLLEKADIEGLNYRSFTANTKYVKGALSIASRVFQIVKAYGYSVYQADLVREKMGPDVRFCRHDAVEQLIRLYDQYDETLRQANLVEYDDQILMVFELLAQDPFLLDECGFRHITVDEFQDSNEKNIELLKHLIQAPSFESLMVVGDDAQAIFSFRDTSPKYIIDFEKYIERDVEDVFLLENHRCTPEIIAFANKINRRNQFRIKKDLVPVRPSGKPVTVKGFQTSKEELEFVIGQIKSQLASGRKPEDIAVITGSKYQLIKVADRLSDENIESVMLNPELMTDNSRVQALIALSNCTHSANDTRDMLIYANALRDGGLKEATAEVIEQEISEVARQVEELRGIPDETAKTARFFEMARAVDHDEDEVYEHFLEGLERKPFAKVIEYLGDFDEFGTGQAYRRIADYPGIVLTTAHSAKGLEWPVCIGMIGNFHDEVLDRLRNHAEAAEEKRRLLFVLATRARDELIITAPYVAYGKSGNYTYNRFLKESFEANGQEFSIEDIEKEKKMRSLDRANARKKKEIEEYKNTTASQKVS